MLAFSCTPTASPDESRQWEGTWARVLRHMTIISVPQPHICTLNLVRNGQTARKKCGTPTLETFLPYSSYFTLETTQVTKTSQRSPLFTYVACYRVTLVLSVSLLPLHFQLKYIKLNKKGEVKITTLHYKLCTVVYRSSLYTTGSFTSIISVGYYVRGSLQEDAEQDTGFYKK